MSAPTQRSKDDTVYDHETAEDPESCADTDRSQDIATMRAAASMLRDRIPRHLAG